MACSLASHTPFTVEEVTRALAAMQPHKSCGDACYSVDIFRGAQDRRLYLMLARIFDHFVLCGYPASLNRLLLHPLYKRKGPLT